MMGCIEEAIKDCRTALLYEPIHPRIQQRLVDSAYYNLISFLG